MADELLVSSTPGGEWQHFKRGALRPSDVVYSGHREINSRHLASFAPPNCLRPEATLDGARLRNRVAVEHGDETAGCREGLAGLGLDERRLRRQLQVHDQTETPIELKEQRR